MFQTQALIVIILIHTCIFTQVFMQAATNHDHKLTQLANTAAAQAREVSQKRYIKNS